MRLKKQLYNSIILLFITILVIPLILSDWNNQQSDNYFNENNDSNKLFKSITKLVKIKKWKEYIVQKLKSQGVNEDLARDYLGHNEIDFKPQLIAINLGFISELNSYTAKQKSISPQNMGYTQSSFMRDYSGFLRYVSEQYNIPEELILSILYVETGIGMNTGRFSVLDTYFNLSLLQHPEARNVVFQWITDNYYINSFNQLVDRAQSKGQWGFGELVSLINIATKNKLDITKLNGSYAGAFGISQFVPSSYISYAKDGNGDGIVDLFNIKDAVVSTANYLSRMRWRHYSGSQDRAILAYNNSYSYLSKVVDYSNRLRNQFFSYKLVPATKKMSEIDSLYDKLFKVNNNY